MDTGQVTQQASRVREAQSLLQQTIALLAQTQGQGDAVEPLKQSIRMQISRLEHRLGALRDALGTSVADELDSSAGADD